MEESGGDGSKSRMRRGRSSDGAVADRSSGGGGGAWWWWRIGPEQLWW